MMPLVFPEEQGFNENGMSLLLEEVEYFRENNALLRYPSDFEFWKESGEFTIWETFWTLEVPIIFKTIENWSFVIIIYLFLYIIFNKDTPKILKYILNKIKNFFNLLKYNMYILLKKFLSKKNLKILNWLWLNMSLLLILFINSILHRIRTLINKIKIFIIKIYYKYFK